MEAHQETSPTLHRECQECSTKEQTEDISEGVQETKDEQIETEKELTEENQRLRAKITVLEKRIKAKDGQIQELQQELKNLNVSARKLLLENNKESLEAEMDEKNKKEEELKAKIKELEQQLADLLKARRKDLQQSGEICEMNCVLSCLVCACQLKMQNVHLCYDHLGRIIMHGEEKIRYLRCGAYLDLLVTREIAKREKQIYYNSDAEARDKQIDEIWEILKTTTGDQLT